MQGHGFNKGLGPLGWPREEPSHKREAQPPTQVKERESVKHGGPARQHIIQAITCNFKILSVMTLGRAPEALVILGREIPRSAGESTNKSSHAEVGDSRLKVLV